LQRGEFDQAIQEFEIVYDLQPDSLVAANNLASMLADFHASSPELVDRAYAIAQRLAGSRNPSHLDTYGWILYLRGEYTLALRSLRPAAEQLRNDPWVQYHAGMVYSKLNQPENARRHLQAALDAGGSHMFPLRQQAQEALDALPTQ
jgi:tetratricopeptide (TPR) repeat protein